MKPSTFILIGFVLVVLGVLLPALMVFKVIPSSLFVSFVSYAASIAGLFLGMWGAFSYVRIERYKRKQEGLDQDEKQH